MSLFDSTYPLDYLFLKVAGNKQVVALALCEVTHFVPAGAVFDPKSSNKDQVVFIEQKENGKSFNISRKDFIARVQADMYGDKLKVTDYVIQPEGENQLPEVTAFLEKY